MMAPGTPLSRMAALALLAAVIFAASEGVVRPLLARWQANEDAIAAASDQTARLAAIAARRDNADRSLVMARAAVEAAGMTLRVPAEGLASADVREALADLAGTFGADLRSVRILPVEQPGDGPRRIVVEVDLRGGFDAVLGALHGIETARPYVFVREATLSTPTGRAALRNQGQAPVMELSLRLYAYMPHDEGSGS
jgi:hypothetical protein